MTNKYFTLVVIMAALTLGACTKSQQARDTELSGFLGNYSMLRKGGDDEALFIYRKPNIPFKKYTKIIIDPVVIWMDQDSELAKLKGSTRQELTNRFHYYMRKEISQVMQVVDRPSEGTMRFQVALTDAE